MNNKGWLRIIEAIIAIMIISGAILFFSIRETYDQSNEDRIYEKQTMILDIIAENDSLRNDILSQNNHRINEYIEKLIPISWDYRTKICPPIDICNTDLPEDKEVFVTEKIITSNLSYYQIKKIRFFIWLK